MIAAIAVPSPSIIWDPYPQFHSGSRTANAWPSGTWSGQVTLGLHADARVAPAQPHGVDHGRDQRDDGDRRKQQDEDGGHGHARAAGVGRQRPEQTAGRHPGDDADDRRPDPAPASMEQPNGGGDLWVGISDRRLR
jgi:hypothetical protein